MKRDTTTAIIKDMGSVDFNGVIEAAYADIEIHTEAGN
jgi:hypothetical protein